jgi:hypothetical protein
VAEVYLESRLEFLRKTQNQDGGWGYFPGKKSWLEPTAYAMLALQGRRGVNDPTNRAWKLMRSWQLPDGSYRPGDGIDGGTLVTAHAVTVACARGVRDASVLQSVDWLLRVDGAESSLAMRAASYLHLLKTREDFSHPAWPWREGNASWVEPTAHALVALKKASSQYASGALLRRVHEGEEMLLTRRCSDGGWNCGNPNVYDYDLPSYPETTALALHGLQGRSASDLAGPLAVARRFQSDTRSSLAQAWLAIALRNLGQNLPAPADETCQRRDVMLAALEALGHPSGNHALLRAGGPA